MKTRTTLILLAIVVALGVYIKFYESKRPNSEEARRRAGNVVTIDREKINRIVVENGDDMVDLRKEGGIWRLESPVKDQADLSTVEGLIAELDSWEKERAISAKEMEAEPGRLEEYGLDKPKLRLTLHGGEKPTEILFGKETALEGRMYVRLQDSKDVYIAAQNIREQITKKPEEFRDHRLTNLVTGDVTRLVLRSPAGELEVQKQGDQWLMTRPLRVAADPQRVQDLIAQITTARIQQFVADDQGDLQSYGLTQPRGAVTLFREGEKEGHTLEIGGPAEAGKEQVYVRFSARRFVYTLPKRIEEVLDKRPEALRDRHLVRFNRDTLDRITIEAPGKAKAVLARKDQAWTIASKDNAPADAAEVTRLLDTLQNETVTQFVADVATDLAKYGLDQPQLIVTLSSFASENTVETEAGEQPMATLRFGKVEGENVYVRESEEPFVVAARRTLPNDIAADPTQWQTLSIFAFKPERIHRLSVKSDRTVSLVRGDKEEWKWVEGAGPINQTNVQSLLNTLGSLRAVRWAPKEVAEQAFGTPQRVITFTTSPDDKETHELTVGGSFGDGMWLARVSGREGTFVLSNPHLNALKLPLSDAAPISPSSPPSSPAPPAAPPTTVPNAAPINSPPPSATP